MGKVNRRIIPPLLTSTLLFVMGEFFPMFADFEKPGFNIISALALVVYGRYLFLGVGKGIEGLRTVFIRSWLLLLLNTLYFLVGAVSGLFYVLCNIFSSENVANGFDFLFQQFIYFALALFITMAYFYEKGTVIAKRNMKTNSYVGDVALRK